MPLLKITKDADLRTVINYYSEPGAAKSPAKSQSSRAPVKKLPLPKAVRQAPTAATEEAPAVPEQARAKLSKKDQQKQDEDEMLSKFTDDDFKNPVIELSEQKKRDYGYGVPQWSPYRSTKVTSTPEWKSRLWSTCNQEWGSYSKQKNALDPATQSRIARGMVKEMKANACIDHTWEIVGSRPGVDPTKPQFFMP